VSVSSSRAVRGPGTRRVRPPDARGAAVPGAVGARVPWPRSAGVLTAALLAGVLLAGCGTEDVGEPGDPGTDQDAPTDPERDEERDVPDDGDAEDLDALAARVAAEVAEEEGVDVEAVTVVSAEEVTWADGAIGCPEEGGMYTQALVEGYRIIVEVDGRELHYHGGLGQPPFRCDDPQPPAEGA
jgi:hypothetical protein